MNFQDIYDTIKQYALNTQSVNSFWIGDVYMNLNSKHVSYGAFNADINNIRRVDGYDVISFQFCYADHLKNDSSNLFEIQSAGYNVMINVIKHLKEHFELDTYEDITITPFRQQFADINAGVFCDVNIYIPVDECFEYDKE